MPGRASLCSLWSVVIPVSLLSQVLFAELFMISLSRLLRSSMILPVFGPHIHQHWLAWVVHIAHNDRQYLATACSRFILALNVQRFRYNGRVLSIRA